MSNGNADNTRAPAAEYQRRLETRRAEQRELERKYDRLAGVRGVVFLLALGLFIAAVSPLEWSFWWLLLPAGAFIALVIVHELVARRLTRTRDAVGCWQDGLSRLNDRWAGVGPTGERYLEAGHSYAADLDLFRNGGLYQRLCRARTRIGEDMLADWLLAPADPAEIAVRHAAIAELREQLDLHENLAVLETEVHDDLDQNMLRHWAAEPAHPVSPAVRVASAALGVLAIAGLAGWLLLGWRLWIPTAAVMAQILLTSRFGRHLKDLAVSADRAGEGLGILARVLGLFERRDYRAAKLTELHDRLTTDGHPPSWQIARLHRLIARLNNSLKNQFFAPIAFVLGLHVQLIHAIESWKATNVGHIPDWLDAVGEFEALTSLAIYAYERPGDCVAEVVSDEAVPRFESEELGHPLLAAGRCVHNDVLLNAQTQLLLVSGSNMSGKSTLLRAIGVNAVLALCGGSVRAKRLVLTPLAVGASMRIQDSLQDGQSLFYAVVSRMKSIVDLADGQPPLLFLLDEILPGTNSHDRRIGAEAVIRGLLARHTIGLVTTHDLALTEIVPMLTGAVNVHFEDHLQNGRMTFDYRLRPGVVQKSNALELMRMVGLDV